MTSSSVQDFVHDPQVFDTTADAMDVLQTHISYVVLTGEYAYKIKKPVDFGFLDFTTLEKRRYYCEEEVRLNKRLCPEIYVDVVPITHDEEGYRVEGDGEVVEYAVRMHQFPQDRIMRHLLQEGLVGAADIERICGVLTDFYERTTSSDEIKQYGQIETIKGNTDENFEQTADIVGKTITRDQYDFIKQATNRFLDEQTRVFHRRIDKGFIRDCHGDLHSGNIVIHKDDRVCVFDCIEFNKRFRFSDVASDIGFLAMDLDFLNHPYLSSYLMRQYVKKSNDDGVLDVLNFYKCYRAYVRGKVIGFQLDDPDTGEEEKQEIREIVRRYYDLASYYAHLFSLDLDQMRPVVFMMCGLTGTGKSSVAQILSVDYHAEWISTDMVRKELEDMGRFERRFDEFGTGLYTPEKIDATYERVIEKVSNALKNGRNCIADATFQQRKHRDMLRTAAKDHGAHVVLVECVCPEEEIKQRLEERVKGKSVSEGRWEIYVQQKQTFDALGDDEPYVTIDTSKTGYAERRRMFTRIYKAVHKGVT